MVLGFETYSKRCFQLSKGFSLRLPTLKARSSQIPIESLSKIMDAPPSYSSAVNSSQEDDRPLPEGWIRRLDPRSNRCYYVDMTSHPPRSTTVHPLDDEEYINSLPPRDRKEHNYTPTHPEKSREAVNYEYDYNREGAAGPSRQDNLPPRSTNTPSSQSSNGLVDFGRRYGANLVEDRFGSSRYDRRMQYDYGYQGQEVYAQDPYGHDARAGVLMVPVDRYAARGMGFRGRRRRGGLIGTLIRTAAERR